MRITTMRQALEAMREKIKDPKHWTQGSNAKTSDNRPVPVKSELACKFCLSGAAISITKDSDLKWYAPVDELQKFNYLDSIPKFNDHSTHAEVMELLDRAIAAQPAEPV